MIPQKQYKTNKIYWMPHAGLNQDDKNFASPSFISAKN